MWDVKVRIIYSNKPVFGGAFSIDGLLAEIELLSVLAGGKEEMEKRPRVFAGINMIRGVGMLDHGGAVSIEKMIYDNEVCGMIHRLINGITVTEETLAVDFIKENKHDAASILGSDLTLDWFRKELFVPSKNIIARTSYTKYVENGSKEIFSGAREKKHQILNTYKAPAIDMHTLDEMKRILTEYAEKKGEEIPEFLFNY